jgi:RNA polymerase sigma-70 factor (ECF subfamily)
MSGTLWVSADLAGIAQRIREGDPAAEDELVRQFGERVRVFAAMRTRDRETARDLGQEVMIGVLTALRQGQLRDPDRLAAFVYGIARNIVNNHLRIGRARPSEPLVSEIPAASPDPVERIETGRRHVLVRGALARLNRADRGILLLTLVDGLKPAEIASRLGLTAEVVRVRKSRALKKVVDRVSAMTRKPG